MKRRLTTALMVLTLSTALASAQTVELVLMHAGLLEADADSYLAEHLIGGGLAELFERGLIGTNESPVAGSLAAFDGYTPRGDAAESYIDRIVLILATYPAPGAGPRIPDCRFKVIGVPDGTAVFSGEMGALAPATPSRLDLEKANGAMGQAIVAACASSL